MSFIGFDGKGYQSFIAESVDLVTWTNLRLAIGFGAFIETSLLRESPDQSGT